MKDSYKGEKSHTRGHEGEKRADTSDKYYEGDYPRTYKDHSGHLYASHHD